MYSVVWACSTWQRSVQGVEVVGARAWSTWQGAQQGVEVVGARAWSTWQGSQQDVEVVGATFHHQVADTELSQLGSPQDVSLQ